MKKRILVMIAALLLVVGMIPLTASADSHYSDIYCGSESFSYEGCTWDAENKVLSLGDVVIEGHIEITSGNVTIQVTGNVLVEGSILTDTDTAETVTVNGSGRLEVKGMLGLNYGNLTIENVTAVLDYVSQACVGHPQEFKISDGADVTISTVNWMTNGGIFTVENSKLTVADGVLWTERLSIDDSSTVELVNSCMSNYGNVDYDGGLDNFLPEGYSAGYYDGSGSNTILDAEGNVAYNLVLQRYFTVTGAVDGEGGTITESVRVAYGESAVFELTPDEGYRVVTVEDNTGTGTLSGNTYTTDAVTCDNRIVKVKFIEVDEELPPGDTGDFDNDDTELNDQETVPGPDEAPAGPDASADKPEAERDKDSTPATGDEAGSMAPICFTAMAVAAVAMALALRRKAYK